MSKWSESPSSSAASTDSEKIIFKAKGFCKFFDAFKGYGYISIEKDDKNADHGDIFFYHTAIFMTGYRALTENEEVLVEYLQNDVNKYEAKKITGTNCEL